VDGLSLQFGGIQALAGVSLSVGRDAICGLVGPNGAGKTSLFNCVCGLYRATSGTIRLDGHDITRVPAHRLAALGLARTFQHPVLRPEATVLDNVLLGGHTQLRAGALAHAFWLRGSRKEERELRERALELLSWLEIEELAEAEVASLSFGTLKRVEFARALLAEPRLLLLDELASGLVHEEVMALAEVIVRVRRERNVGILLVEHHMGLVSSICDKVVVLVQGRNLAEGSPREVAQNPAVVEAYLGAAA